MMVLEPTTISSVTLASGQTQHPDYPISNLLLDAPELPFLVTSGGFVTSINIVVDGPLDSFSLLGVESITAGVTFIFSDYSAVPGAVVVEHADAYRPGRRNYWIRFTEQTGSALEFRIIIPFTVGSPGETIRAGCLKAGTTHEQTGVLYPLEEGLDDPTVQIPLADGSVYRGAQIAPARTFGATVRALRSEVEPFMATLRRIGGKQTMWHMAPDLGDYYFLYGRLAGMPQASHAWPVVSSASLAVREWV